MRTALVLALFFLSAPNARAAAWQPAPGATQTPIWPGTPPDARPLLKPETAVTRPPVAGKPWTEVENVSIPMMTVYPAKGKNTGAAVVVFPGGGYQILAIDLEGTEACDWLTSEGITCVLLKYRVPCGVKGQFRECRQALQDAQRTIGLVRHDAAHWRIDPRKIGVLGFSAGGHMVAATSTQFKARAYPPIDAADAVSCRPDFAMALYPGHLWSDDPTRPFNPSIRVTTQTPPTFLAQAEDDPVDSVNNSLSYFGELKRLGVPAELHVYPHGGHAFGLRRTGQPITDWPTLAQTWLRAIGMLPARTPRPPGAGAGAPATLRRR